VSVSTYDGIPAQRSIGLLFVGYRANVFAKRMASVGTRVYGADSTQMLEAGISVCYGCQEGWEIENENGLVRFVANDLFQQ
jgi:hypothetical protein